MISDSHFCESDLLNSSFIKVDDIPAWQIAFLHSNKYIVFYCYGDFIAIACSGVMPIQSDGILFYY